MSPILGSSENSRKPRCIKLVPKPCIAIGFARQNSSSSSSSPSSLSGTSDHVTCEHCDTAASANRQSGRNPPKSPSSKPGTYCETGASILADSAQHQAQTDRQSFSSMSTGTTTDNRDCLCQQPVNCVELFNEFLRENMFSTCFMLPSNSLTKLDLVGFIYPTTLLIAGNQESLKLLSSLWSRRLLKAPLGYGIRFVGE